MSIPTLPFGRTGHKSTRVIFGGAALAAASEQLAGRALELLLRYGINHIDVAAAYGDAELRVRPWLREHPNHFFLATKTGGRTAAAAREDLERSLDRMGVDHVDLWQLHSLADPIEWDRALSPGGAIDAAVEARAQGLVRWIGITGHGTQIAAQVRRSLQRFDFDSVLLPCNYLTMQIPYYREHFEAVIDLCRQRRVAVQTIKSVALRPWMGRPRSHTTWYEPLEDAGDIELAVRWVLGRPGIFLSSVSDLGLLPSVLEAADRDDGVPVDAEMRALFERVRAEPIFV